MGATLAWTPWDRRSGTDDTLELTPGNGLNVTRLDLGYPSVRTVSQDRPGADGSIDDTTHHGSRLVTLTATVTADSTGRTKAQVVDRLAVWCHPSRRPWLWWDHGPGDVRQVRLRADKATAPLTSPHLGDIQVSWVAPTGLIEAGEESAIMIPPVGTPAAGRDYPLTYDRTYPPAAPSGPVTVTSAGSAPAPWIARIFGPCTGPTLSTDSGDSVALPGLTVAAGDYLEIDSENHTVRLNGSPAASRYSFLDFPSNTWWQIQPGRNLVTFAASATSATTAVHLAWRDQHLL